jgi:hypothetical protein
MLRPGRVGNRSAVARFGERSNDDEDGVDSTTPSYLLSVGLSTVTPSRHQGMPRRQIQGTH